MLLRSKLSFFIEQVLMAGMLRISIVRLIIRVLPSLSLRSKRLALDVVVTHLPLGRALWSININLTQLPFYSHSIRNSTSPSRILIKLLIVVVIGDLNLVMVNFQHGMDHSISAIIVNLSQVNQHTWFWKMKMVRMLLLGSIKVSLMLLRSSASKWSSRQHETSKIKKMKQTSLTAIETSHAHALQRKKNNYW